MIAWCSQVATCRALSLTSPSTAAPPSYHPVARTVLVSSFAGPSPQSCHGIACILPRPVPSSFFLLSLFPCSCCLPYRIALGSQPEGQSTGWSTGRCEVGVCCLLPGLPPSSGTSTLLYSSNPHDPKPGNRQRALLIWTMPISWSGREFRTAARMQPGPSLESHAPFGPCWPVSLAGNLYEACSTGTMSDREDGAAHGSMGFGWMDEMRKEGMAPGGGMMESSDRVI